MVSRSSSVLDLSIRRPARGGGLVGNVRHAQVARDASVAVHGGGSLLRTRQTRKAKDVTKAGHQPQPARARHRRGKGTPSHAGSGRDRSREPRSYGRKWTQRAESFVPIGDRCSRSFAAPSPWRWGTETET